MANPIVIDAVRSQIKSRRIELQKTTNVYTETAAQAERLKEEIDSLATEISQLEQAIIEMGGEVEQ